MDSNGVQFSVGIGGWEHDVLDHCFYPRSGMTSAEKLAFYAEYFSVVEVRATFWDESLGAADAQEWASAVSGRKNFRFSVKLHKAFTHDRAFPAALTKSTNLLLRELARKNRLGAVLLQFPYRFTSTGANRQHLIRLSESFQEYPLFVELRHSSWNTAGLLPFLAEHAMRPVSADMPKVNQYMPFLTGLVGNAAYVRLHGRNEKGWLLNGYDSKYDYLYNGKELAEIRRRTDAMAGRCNQGMIICNNTTGGKAVATGFQIAASLRHGTPPIIPPMAYRMFPLLQDIGRPKETHTSLFDQPDLRTAV